MWQLFYNKYCGSNFDHIFLGVFFFSSKHGKYKVHLAMCSATLTNRNNMSIEPGTSLSSENEIFWQLSPANSELRINHKTLGLISLTQNLYF